MAKMIVGFEEIGGITEFSGLQIYKAAALVINKAADILINSVWYNTDDENFVDYTKTHVNWADRKVVFEIRLK